MSGSLARVKGHPGVYKVLNSKGEWTGSYKTSYRVNGRQRWKSFGPPDALRKVEQFRATVSVRREDGSLIDPKRGRMTLGTLYDEIRSSRSWAEATASVYATAWKHLQPLAGRSVNTIDTAAVDAVLDGIEAQGMRSKARTLLSVIFTEGVHRKMIAASPVVTLRRKATRAEKMARASHRKPKRILSEDELDALADAIDPKFRLAVILMGRMGIRPGECLALTVEKFLPPTQVPPNRGELVINTSISSEKLTKTGESRTLVLPRSISEAVAAHIKTYTDGESDSPLFTVGAGRAITSKDSYRAWVRRHFTPASVKANVNHGLSPNDLRHTAAAWAISLGGTVYDVQRMLGHGKPSITLDVYGSLWEAKHADLIERMERVLPRALPAAQG